jgi:PGDYG protein
MAALAPTRPRDRAQDFSAQNWRAASLGGFVMASQQGSDTHGATATVGRRVGADSVPLFRSTATPGFSSVIAGDPRRVNARKLVREIEVCFASGPCTVMSREGAVHAQPGDAIITGIAGEHWRVSRAHFSEKYRPVPPTVAGESGRYASLPNRIIAVPMTEAFEVLLGDGVSRLHGLPGDWLVDYGDGSLGVVSAAIFAVTYDVVD